MSAKIGTRTRILQRSISLFNRDGIKAVAVGRVADELGISPGNLTYHFKRKSDLVHAILDEMEDHLQAAMLAFPFPKSADDYATAMLSIYRALWQYRFVFSGLGYLVQMDDEIEKRYLNMQDHVLETIEKEANMAISSGYMRAFEAPTTARLFAENLWAIWVNWVVMHSYTRQPSRRTESAVLYECALHHISLVQPYMERRFALEVQQAFASACGRTDA